MKFKQLCAGILASGIGSSGPRNITAAKCAIALQSKMTRWKKSPTPFLVAIFVIKVGLAHAASRTSALPQPTPAARPSIAPQAVEIVQRACHELSIHNAFTFHAEVMFDEVLQSGVKLQFAGALDYAVQRPEGLLQFQPHHIGGEVTIPTTKASNSGPADPKLKKQLSITIRVTRIGKKDPRLSRVLALSAVKPKDAISESAKAAFQLIDPYVLTTYEYEVEKNQHRALYLTTQCYGDFVKWGRLLEGIILEDQDDLNGAIDKYSEAANLDPGWAYPDNNWGNVLYKNSDYNGAVVQYDKATQLDSQYADAYDGYGAALFGKQDYDGAIAEYRQALKLDPKNAKFYENWGNALSWKQDYDGAIAKYRQALKLDPKNAVFRANLEAARKSETTSVSNHVNPPR